jgi:nucleoside-diphosphate-sugar epimerase
MTLNRVLLIGATGHLGRHFVSALREKGKEVLMLLRPRTGLSGLNFKRRWHECLSSEAVGFRELGTAFGVGRLQAASLA